VPRSGRRVSAEKGKMFSSAISAPLAKRVVIKIELYSRNSKT